MGLTNDELIRRKNDEHVKFITSKICNKDGNKPYVFVSYKSDDWEKVLHDIVYTLVKEYHLNVYFDGDFDGHNPLWTEQFPDNMEDPLCRGVLVFVDDKYATSYAALLELMYSQGGCQDPDDFSFVNKNVVPIYLSKLTKIEDDADTGLGTGVYEDKTKNIHAKDEKVLFDDTFENICDTFNIFKKSKKPYMKQRKLSKKLCSVMVEELLAYIGANDNYYQGIDSLDVIVKSIKDACGDEVFDSSDTTVNVETTTQSPMVTTPTTPKMTDTSATPVLNTWSYRGKDANATLIWDGESKTCTVLAGSKVGTEASGFVKLPAAKKLKDSIMEQKILIDGCFVQDYECDKISTMINVLNGGSVSMPSEIKNGHFAPINETKETGQGHETDDEQPVKTTTNGVYKKANGTKPLEF